MSRWILILVITAFLSACAQHDPRPESYGRLTEKARAWVQAERQKDREVCQRDHASGSDAYALCLDDRQEARRTHLRQLQEWFRERRLGQGRSDCIDPARGDVTICYDI